MIPTAENFFEEWCNKKGYTSIDEADDIHECMIEFAQLHVKQALQKASENAYFRIDGFVESSKENQNSILNAYPLTNVK